MSTKNPRLTITLQPAVAAQLRELSRLTGNSQSYLIADLLDGSQPVFDRVIQVLTAAEEAKLAIKGKLAADMDAAQSKVEAQLGLSLETLNEATQSLIDEAEQIKRRSRKGARGQMRSMDTSDISAPSTPLSNRGVRLQKNATKTIAKNAAPTRSKPSSRSQKTTGVEK